MKKLIAGKSAKTADLEMLKIAQEAKARGMSKEKVFDATGKISQPTGCGFGHFLR